MMDKSKDSEKLNSEEKRKIKKMIAHSSISILGPLLFIGGIGLFLDRHYEANKKILLSSVAIAFVVTNILLIRRAKMALSVFTPEERENIKSKKDEEKKKEDY